MQRSANFFFIRTFLPYLNSLKKKTFLFIKTIKFMIKHWILLICTSILCKQVSEHKQWVVYNKDKKGGDRQEIDIAE